MVLYVLLIILEIFNLWDSTLTRVSEKQFSNIKDFQDFIFSDTTLPRDTTLFIPLNHKTGTYSGILSESPYISTLPRNTTYFYLISAIGDIFHETNYLLILLIKLLSFILLFLLILLLILSFFLLLLLLHFYHHILLLS